VTAQSIVDMTPDGQDLLRTVQGVLATIVADVSGPPDEAFAPHQRLFDHALGSLQVLQVHAHLEEALGIDVASEPFPVEALTLYRSHLQRPAARYEPLRSFPLGQRGG